MKLSNKLGVQEVVASFATLGIKDIILCPGSRNAPLIFSFARHPNFNCISIRDERSAGFFALGKAIESSKPTVLISTSGSAILNFAPAIVEAYYQRIPLIILTADRTKEWVHQGDGQTMNQENVYQNYIRKSFSLDGDDNSQVNLWYNRRCISEAFHTAIYKNKGPVHINFRLAEPLYETSDFNNDTIKIFKEEPVVKSLSAATKEQFLKDFNKSKKVLILVGQYPKSKKLNSLLERIATHKNVIILCESTSNLQSLEFVHHIDRCISFLDEEEINKIMPEMLITIGGAIISKRIKLLLRKNKTEKHWNIHNFDAYMDTYQSLSNAVAMEAEDFLEQVINDLSNVESSYKENWENIKERREDAHVKFMSNCKYSDLKVFETIYKELPDNINLHLANSSVIRYAQLFENRKTANNWSNRGVSGIDGCTSTAMGAASSATEKDFILITGDMSFHYDKNAFWNEEDINNLKIIVINNGGGSIFNIIPGPDNLEETEKFLEAKMTNTAKEIAIMHGWNYRSINNEKELQIGLKDFFKSEGKQIVEIFTDAKKSPETLKNYWKFISKN